MIAPLYNHEEKQGGFYMGCDFCAAPENSVFVLIASPNGTHICDVCVKKCEEIIDEKETEASK